MAAGGARRALIWGALVVALLAIVVAAFVERLHRPEPPPHLGAVPDFSLLDTRGERLSLRDLAGRPWIADFIFTRCAASCPLMTERLARLDGEIPREPPLRLISISVDPANDRPEVLARYARAHGASPRWSFLTGEPDAVYALVRRGFKLGVDPIPAPLPAPLPTPLPAAPAEGPKADSQAVPEPITHSTRFVLVDGKARIRGYYDAFDPESIARLKRDLRAVQRGG